MLRRLRMLGIVAAVIGLLLVAVVPTFATPDQTGDALRQLRDRATARDDSSEPDRQPARALAAASQDCWNDPTGDTYPSPYDRADVTRWCTAFDGSQIVVTMKLAQPTNPDTDENWVNSSYTGILWEFDVTGDGTEDFYTGIVNPGGGAAALVIRADGTQTCDATETYGSGTYQVTFPANCIGAPEDLWTRAYAAYDSQWDDPYAPVFEDQTSWGGPLSPATATQEPPPAAPAGPAEKGRLAGETRYDTAVRISRYAWPDGAAEVYLARADNYPDALAGSSLSDGPLLLVPQCGTVPQSVLDEVRRLAPAKVIALGGPVAVCEQVLDDAVAATR